jgi:hypothetical protein
VLGSLSLSSSRRSDLRQRSAQLTRDLEDLEARRTAFEGHVHKIADFARR